jgi:predicted DCC family thiol-disulfide oxidoreductase YuxK
MKKLIILFDDECRFCRRVKEWLTRQPSYLELELVPFPGQQADNLTASLDPHPGDQLVVFSDTGGIYSGEDAWLMVLWALEEWRPWSLRLSAPGLKPLARKLFQLISDHRYQISDLIPLQPTDEAVPALAAVTVES